MPLICDRAICIRRFEYSETSQILALFTRSHGLIRVIAKGAHRTTKAGASRFDGGLDLLDEGDALFSDRVEKDLNILAEWKLLDGHRGVRGSRRSLYLGLYLAEILGTVFPLREPQPDIFARFAWTLDQLSTPDREAAGLALVLDMLLESGFMPSLDRCVACEREINGESSLFYSPRQGGMLCERCAPAVPDRRPIDGQLVMLVSMLAGLSRADFAVVGMPSVSEPQADPLHAMLARHIEHTVGHRLRMIRQLLPRRANKPAENAE